MNPILPSEKFKAHVSGHFLKSSAALCFTGLQPRPLSEQLCLVPICRFYPPPVTFPPCQRELQGDFKILKEKHPVSVSFRSFLLTLYCFILLLQLTVVNLGIQTYPLFPWLKFSFYNSLYISAIHWDKTGPFRCSLGTMLKQFLEYSSPRCRTSAVCLHNSL